MPNQRAQARRRPVFVALLVLVAIGFVVGIVRLYLFVQSPMNEGAIRTDAIRIASRSRPRFNDADLLVPKTEIISNPLQQDQRRVQIFRAQVRKAPTSTTERAASDSAGLGIGEIRIHNRTGENASIVLVIQDASRQHTSAAGIRRLNVPASGDVSLNDLAPNVYFVEVSFPGTQHAEFRVGPFTMAETEAGREKKGDRYEITLRPDLLRQ